MRKTIIPAAIILAAPAVTMQAQEVELTFEAIQKEISAVSSAISSYPKDVKDKYLPQLSAQENALRAVKDDDVEKEAKYTVIVTAVAQIKTDAEGAEKAYAEARDAALKAIADAKKVLKTAEAESTINALKVPSVRTTYTTDLQALKLEAPAEPEAKDLYESQELSNSMKIDWVTYKTKIETLASEATSANKAEMEAQPGRKTTLAGLIETAKGNVNTTLGLVGTYVGYTGKDGHLATISAVTDELTTISSKVEQSFNGLELTESQVEIYKSEITGQETTLTETADAALVDAKDKAKKDADAKVKDLHEYDEFGPDDYTTIAKQQANEAIRAAQAAAGALGGEYVQAKYDAQEKEVETKITAVKNAIAAVDLCEKNYEAYADLKATYETLKTAYEAAAIQLSTLKANGGFDDNFYNEANSQLNVVAQMLETFAKTNQDNYGGKAYSDGVGGKVYAAVQDLLDANYDSADEIKQIVIDAEGYNDTLATLTGYQTQVEGINATVSHDKVDDNEVYAAAVNTLNKELEGTKSGLATVLDGLVEVWRKDKTLGMTFDGIKQEISKLKDAIKTAQADLNAYVSSKEQVATWTASVNAILGQIPNPVSQDYENHGVLEGDRTTATTYQSEIGQLGVDADNAFKASPRSSKDVWNAIQNAIQNGTDYGTKLLTLAGNVDVHLTPYQKWLDEQGDVAAYNLGKQYCKELKDSLDAAKVATTAPNAPTAKGFDKDEAAITALETEVEETHKAAGHKFNDCILAMKRWQEQYDKIKQSIETHKQAWLENEKYYAEKTDTLIGRLNGILAFEATTLLNLYTNLNETNQGIIDKDIDDAKSALDAKYNDQEASSFIAADERTKILNKIAQLKLQEELDASGIGGDEGAISTVRNQLKTKEGWNPKSNVYGTRLEGLETEFTTFTDGVKYADYQTKHNRIDNQQEGHLKAAILAVATDAEKNYTEYTKQQNAQTAAKAAWANIYSQVGAMYVDATGKTDFSGAQTRYQEELNKCFTVLTGYDTKIEDAYNAGTSALFNTTEYGDSIAANKKAMDGTYKAAYDNKAVYDEQMRKFGQLETYYSEKQTDLWTQINTVIASIEGATAEEFAEELKSLEAQKQALGIAWGKLDDVKTTYIDVLKEAVVEAVNAGGSVKYAYDTKDRVIRSTIDDIISTADGSYNDNIVAHNAVVKKLFEEAYYAAKNAYNNYTFQIEAYAGYKHALNENGVSAYAKAIEEAQKAIFDLNTDLVAKYNDATKKLSSTTEYVDKGQTHKAAVNTLKAELDDAYNDFLVATKDIADEKGYAQPLSDLATYYTNAKTAIAGYDIITGIKATSDEEAEGITDAKKQAAAVAKYFTFDGEELDGTALNTAYTTAGEADNEGPQQLDDLLAEVEGQTDQVLTAWNNAAEAEAEAAKSNADESYKFYEDKKYPKGYEPWRTALTAAKNAIDQAKTDIDTYIKTNKLNNEVDGIKTALTTAISALKIANTTAEADQECQYAIETYKTHSDNIEKLKKDIADGYENHQYKAELTKLIDAANDAVTAYKEANETAFNALYDYETSKELSAAQNAADAAYDALVATADELVAANQPAGIVKTLLAKAQELVPLYNRAEANAKGESGSKEVVEECEQINILLNELLDRLNLKFDSTDPAVLEKIENEANAQQTTKETIENLRQRIINADVEQQKYNALLEELNGENGVKASLGNVKTYIENSTFKTELNEAFSERIAALDIELSAALTQINIDHANNHCGKTEAVFKGFTAISESITALDNEVKAKAGELQTEKDHADMRAANTVKYKAARNAIADADNKLQAEWFNAQESFKDVFTLFNERVKELRSNIATLQDNLTNAYNTAQHEGGVPSDLNTDAYTAKAEEYSDNITNLMGDISARQTQFEADVTDLNKQIAAMNADFKAIKISDVAAADVKVDEEKKAIEADIRDINAKMQNFGPEDTKDVQDKIDAANARITAFAELVAGKTYVPGDITGTGSVDINDTFKILDLVLDKWSGEPLDEKAQKAADMDGDGKYTVVDLVQINNLYVYGSKTGPQGSNKVAAAADAEVGSVDMQLDTDRMSVLLDSNTGYSAIQMDVEMPQGVSINEVNFAGDSQKVMVATNTLENGVQRIVLYSSDGSSILNGESSLLNLGLAGEGMGIVSIDHIIASTAAGQRHNLMGVTGAYTIVTGIEATETAEGNTSVFDINGMVRKTVQKGINIVKDATGKVKKMLMK